MVNLLTESGTKIIYYGESFRGLIVTFDQFTKSKSIHTIAAYLQILEAPGYKFIAKHFINLNSKEAKTVTPKFLHDFAKAKHTTEALILANFILHYGIKMPKENTNKENENLTLF